MKQETLKEIVELADGFEWYINRIEGVRVKFAESFFPYKSEIVRGNLLWKGTYYPLLLRRAVEGMNRAGKYEIYLYVDYILLDLKNPFEEEDKDWDYEDFEKTEYLTPQEQAIEACLIELLEAK